jgi:hypothetical protein
VQQKNHYVMYSESAVGDREIRQSEVRCGSSSRGRLEFYPDSRQAIWGSFNVAAFVRSW